MAKTNTRLKKPSKPASADLNIQLATNIPLDQLILSDANVRQLKTGLSIEALAASIARRGLLQSLSVRPLTDAAGLETGRYEVQAGGRRLRALQLLAKQKRLAKDAAIPCIIKTGGLAVDDSLAENSDREALHPLDQFRAFAALRAKGQGEEEIAAAFNVSPAVVRQRLRLASASPRLLDAYAGDGIGLDQLMAFCISCDHSRQDKLLEAVLDDQVSGTPYNIRRLLTETAIPAGDRRAVFIGLEAYTKAGGTITRDLFEADEGGWLQEPEIVQRLVGEKLAAARDALLADGWKWALAAEEIPYGERQHLRPLQPLKEGLSKKEQARFEALGEEYDAIVAELPDDQQVGDGADDMRARLAEVERDLAVIGNKPPCFAPEDKARAGALVSITHYGQLAIEYGLVRPEDSVSADDVTGDDDDELDATDGEDVAQDREAADLPASSLPDRLVEDLTAYRTVALREALSGDFNVAFLAALHALCLDRFYQGESETCLQLRIADRFLPTANGLGGFGAATRIQERHDSFFNQLPEDPSRLWSALVALDSDRRACLFAHCVGQSVNAVRDPSRRRAGELRHADTLAETLALDMHAAGWSTTVASFLGRVTKAEILDAVREARGEAAAELIAPLKKGDMAREAERLLADTRWLPEPLRTPDASLPEQPATTLPEFLTQGEMDQDAPLAQAAE